MNAFQFSFRRTGAIARNTLIEALRQRLFLFFLLLALLLVLGARWFREFNFGAPELKFVADCGFGAMAFFGAALTITATVQFFLGEIETRTILAVLAKPVGRAEFVLGKFLGTVALVAVFCLLLTGLLAAVLWQREGELLQMYPEAFPHGRSINYAGVAFAGFLQWLKLAVLAAFALLIASFAQTQLFAIGAGYFVLVLGHLQYLAQDAYARAGSLASRFIGAVLASVLPNFHVFSLGDPLSNAAEMSGPHLAQVTLYGFGHLGVACALTVFSFGRREI